MKIKKTILEEFISQTSLSGEHSLLEVKLDFASEGLKLTAVTAGNSVFVQAQIPSAAFEEYAEFGKIGIVNYSELIKVVGALNDEITINKEGNMLVFKGGRKIEVPLADEALIKDIKKVPNLEYNTSFKLDKKTFDDIDKNIQFALNKSDSENLNISCEGDGILKLKYGTKYKFEDRIEVPELKEVVAVDFGKPLLNAVKALTGELMVQVKNAFPVTVMKKTDMYAIKIIVAPKV